MTPDRWTLVIEAGDLTLPAGPVLVMGAPATLQTGAFAGVVAVQGFRPEYDHLVARGIETHVAPPEGVIFAAALVRVGKHRQATLNAVAEALGALHPGGLLMIDGQKDDGVEAIVKQVRAALEVQGVLSKSHGKFAWFTRPERLPDAVLDWVLEPVETEEGYLTIHGGFSVGHADRGSELLVALLPEISGRVADLGAGWGYIAGELLAEQEGIETLALIEADHRMLELAQANVDDPRAAFHWADATRFAPEAPFDVIVSNPPFHVGRKADPDLGRAFIASAARMLSQNGRFFMVANRHLPYEAALKGAFGHGRLLGELEGYKIYEAAKPRRVRP